MKKHLRRLRHRFWNWRIELQWKAMRFVDPFVLRLSTPRASGGDILIVRTDAIGDFILWLNAAKELRRLYPGRRISLLGNSIWTDLAKELPYWDEVWPVDISRLKLFSFYRAKLLRAVRKRGFVLAIQPTYSRVFLLGDALIRASGAQERLGSVGDCHNMTATEKAIADRWYTRQLPAAPGPVTELERNAEFISHLGGQKEVAAGYPTLARLSELPEHLHVTEPYLIVFPGASANLRQWPSDRFAKVAADLCVEKGLVAVLCGSSREIALCESVARNLEAQRVVNLAGRTSLPEFVELVRGARLLIGNETSAVHIAAAVGTPTVCILGGGHYGRFLPYKAGAPAAPESAFRRMPCFGCDWHCNQPHEEGMAVPCVSGITVEDVLNASRRALTAFSVRQPA